MVNKEQILQAFAEELQRQRKAKSFSQEKLAELADMDRSYISELERGIKTPTILTIFKICDALEVQPEALIRKIVGRL